VGPFSDEPRPIFRGPKMNPMGMFPTWPHQSTPSFRPLSTGHFKKTQIIEVHAEYFFLFDYSDITNSQTYSSGIREAQYKSSFAFRSPTQ